MKLFSCRPRTLWIALLYVALVHAVLCLAIAKTNFLPLARKTLGLDPPEERSVSQYQAMLGWFVRDR